MQGIAFKNEEHILISKYVIDREKNNERIRPNELFEVFDESIEINKIFNYNDGEQLVGDIAERYFVGCVKTLQKDSLTKKIEMLTAAANAETDSKKRAQIMAQIVECMKQSKELKK